MSIRKAQPASTRLNPVYKMCASSPEINRLGQVLSIGMNLAEVTTPATCAAPVTRSSSTRGIKKPDRANRSAGIQNDKFVDLVNIVRELPDELKAMLNKAIARYREQHPNEKGDAQAESDAKDARYAKMFNYSVDGRDSRRGGSE